MDLIIEHTTRQETVREVTLEQLNAALALLSNRKCEFIILNDDNSFLQAKWCGGSDLLVELRISLAPDYYEHYSLQNAAASNEYFHDVQEVLEIFWAFHAQEEMPSGLYWHDVKGIIGGASNVQK